MHGIKKFIQSSSEEKKTAAYDFSKLMQGATIMNILSKY